MSVYYEAVESGRITASNVSAAGGSMRRAVKALKRAEAEERNARTPLKRTAHWRRDRENRAARHEQTGGECRG